jgi:type IV pilus assembly protein PilE
MQGKVTKSQGFTLVELVVVIVILGILTAIAYPAYTGWVLKSRRADAHRALTDLANRLERNYLSANTYTVDMTQLGYLSATNVTIEGGMYKLKVDAATAGCPIASCFGVTATPVAGTAQVNDSRCTSLSLASNGVKSATGSVPGSCWK